MNSISQSISALAALSTLASGAGHLATISSYGLLPHRPPQFLGDERHERVEHDQDLVERPGGDGAGLVVERALHQLDVPVAKLSQTKW